VEQGFWQIEGARLLGARVLEPVAGLGLDLTGVFCTHGYHAGPGIQRFSAQPGLNFSLFVVIIKRNTFPWKIGTIRKTVRRYECQLSDFLLRFNFSVELVVPCWCPWQPGIYLK
jgi:hypothetical protein